MEISNVYIVLDHKINTMVYVFVIDKNKQPITENITYQWQRSDSVLNNYINIENATDKEYKLTSSDNYIRCKITYNGIDYISNIIQVRKHNDKSNIQDTVTDVVGKGVALNDIGDESTGQSNISADTKRIEDCIDVILHTSTNEMPMINFKNNIGELLFENVTPTMLANLKLRIQGLLDQYEPRIKVNEIITNYDNLHSIKVVINYSIKNTNINSNYTTLFDLEKE